MARAYAGGNQASKRLGFQESAWPETELHADATAPIMWHRAEMMQGGFGAPRPIAT